MDDWMYTDEKMKLRADCFRALQHHLDDNCRDVYEFCHQWIMGGNTDLEDVEISFMEYVLDRRDYNIGVLERSYNL
jgi:hypothetical protein|tara:strand:- start:226 stop:453 length:228 start_codon:yes stop_codon:yes gene_type:complete